MGNLMIKHLNKRMFRKGIQIIILVYSFLGCNLEYTPYSFVKSDEVIELRFGRKMSESLLDSIKQVLKTSGVELDYTELKFDGNKLSRLAFKISSPLIGGCHSLILSFSSTSISLSLTFE